MSNDHDERELNRLIEALIDSMISYADASRGVEESDYQEFFSNRTLERRKAAAILQEQVRSLGGHPADEGSLRGAVQRLFMDLGAAWKQGPQALVAEMERGEDRILAMFGVALNDEQLSTSSRDRVRECFQLVKEGRDDLERLRTMDAYTGQTREFGKH